MPDDVEPVEHDQAVALGELLFPDVPEEPFGEQSSEMDAPVVLPSIRQVMISYSSHEKRIADDLCASLEDRGIPCWIAPRDVRDGEVYGAAIDRAIQSAKAVVVVLSENSNKSRHVLNEVAGAFDGGLEILALKIDDVSPSNAMAYYLRTVHWEVVNSPSLYRHYLAVGQRLTEIL